MILFLPGDYPFTYYYRGYLPGIYSNSLVLKDFVATGQSGIDQEELQRKVEMADTVVFQRPNNSHIYEFARNLKAQGKKIIFENDDTYLIGKGIDLARLENTQQRQLAIQFAQYTDQFLRFADGAIASTTVLADEYSKINPNVTVLKNTIDPLDEWECKKNETGKFRVGFIGSVTTNDDYIHIKDQIRKLDERGDVTIVILGLKHKDGSQISFMKPDIAFWSELKNVEWHPYVNVTEYMLTLSELALDLAIIPRKDNYFNRCKSNLKALEMSLLNIPVLAQSFKDGPYNGDISPYLTLVSDNGEWYNTIVKIKDEYAPYKALAEEAHDFVLKEYNIETYAKTWVDEIHKL